MDKNSDVERGQDATSNCNVAENNVAGVNPIQHGNSESILKFF